MSTQIVVNHRVDNETPRFDVQLLFDEIGITLDNHQYRDTISLLDMYHVYIRQHQVRSCFPSVVIITNFVTVSEVSTSRDRIH